MKRTSFLNIQPSVPARMRRTAATAGAVVCAAALLAGLARAEDAGYPFDLPKQNPAALAAVQKILPARLKSVGWIYRLQGTASEMTAEVLDGKDYLGGMVCKPHDCGDNKFAFLAARDGSRASAALRSRELSHGKTEYFGQPSAAERTKLNGYLD